ncbi:MAG: hypothetical protein GX617_09995, partial [Lentisphaerae bacterium]|nr:hypothetical protein [Lentisphaerota bacterium]
VFVEAKPSEVWVLVAPSGQQQPYFMLLAGSDLDMRADALRTCFPGMPLFAPTRERGTANVLIGLGVTNADKTAISKPASWPVNAW